jgi:hypothetical protein
VFKNRLPYMARTKRRQGPHSFATQIVSRLSRTTSCVFLVRLQFERLQEFCLILPRFHFSVGDPLSFMHSFVPPFNHRKQADLRGLLIEGRHFLCSGTLGQHYFPLLVRRYRTERYLLISSVVDRLGQLHFWSDSDSELFHESFSSPVFYSVFF